MSTPLPSFVELMASLGLEQKPTASEKDQSPSPPTSPKMDTERTVASPMKAKSSPSLRDSAARQRSTRFSPYSSTVTTSKRRGSLSSLSSSSSGGSISPIQDTFGDRSPRLRRPRNSLSLNMYGSSSDLPANMPISTYVRRKTPATTPTSPTFPQQDSKSDFPDIPMPLTIPVLPSALLPNSASSESFPITPNDSESTFPQPQLRPPRVYKSFSDTSDQTRYQQYSPSLRHFAGVRISTASRYSLNEQYLRRDAALA